MPGLDGSGPVIRAFAAARITAAASTRALSGAFCRVETASSVESYSTVIAAWPCDGPAGAALAAELTPSTLTAATATTGATLDSLIIFLRTEIPSHRRTNTPFLSRSPFTPPPAGVQVTAGVAGGRRYDAVAKATLLR